MRKEHISYLSAAIFIIYGLISHKLIFLALGFVLLIVGLANDIRHKKITPKGVIFLFGFVSRCKINI